MEKILKYQEIDIELSKIEKELKNNEARKMTVKYTNFLKEAEANLMKLESKAGELAASIKNMLTAIEKSKTTVGDYKNDMEDIQSYDEAKYIKNKIAQDSAQVEEQEKMFNGLLVEAEDLSAKYDSLLKNIAKARKLLPEQKKIFDEIVKEKRPVVESLQSEQQALKAQIDGDVLAEYESVRKQGILPVYVPLINGKSCGGCRMELTASEVAKLDGTNTIKCENCFRKLYLVK